MGVSWELKRFNFIELHFIYMELIRNKSDANPIKLKTEQVFQLNTTFHTLLTRCLFY